MIMVEVIKVVSSFLVVLVQCGTLFGMAYTVFKFSKKPTDDLEHRVGYLENWARDTDKRLHTGAEHFALNDEGQKVTQAALLAIIDALIGMDGIKDSSKTELLKQKSALYEYLTK